MQSKTSNGIFKNNSRKKITTINISSIMTKWSYLFKHTKAETIYHQQTIVIRNIKRTKGLSARKMLLKRHLCLHKYGRRLETVHRWVYHLYPCILNWSKWEQVNSTLAGWYAMLTVSADDKRYITQKLKDWKQWFIIVSGHFR